MRRRSSAARRREAGIHFWKWFALAIALVAALVLGFRAPLAADAVLAYFLAGIVSLLAARVSWLFALMAVPAALIAYRAAFELAWREPPDSVLSMTAATLFTATAIVTSLWRASARVRGAFTTKRPTTICLDYDVFVLVLSKDLARCTRHNTVGALALLRLRGMEALLRPDAYQQHDLVIRGLLRALAGNLRGSDMACYLGHLLIAVLLPHTNADGAQRALDRVKEVAASMPQRLCPALAPGPLDWEIVCLEYPQDGTSAEHLIANAARTLSGVAAERIGHLERRRAGARQPVENPA